MYLCIGVYDECLQVYILMFFVSSFCKARETMWCLLCHMHMVANVQTN